MLRQSSIFLFLVSLLFDLRLLAMENQEGLIAAIKANGYEVPLELRFEELLKNASEEETEYTPLFQYFYGRFLFLNANRNKYDKMVQLHQKAAEGGISLASNFLIFLLNPDRNLRDKWLPKFAGLGDEYASKEELDKYKVMACVPPLSGRLLLNLADDISSQNSMEAKQISMQLKVMTLWTQYAGEYVEFFYKTLGIKNISVGISFEELKDVVTNQWKKGTSVQNKTAMFYFFTAYLAHNVSPGSGFMRQVEPLKEILLQILSWEELLQVYHKEYTLAQNWVSQRDLEGNLLKPLIREWWDKPLHMTVSPTPHFEYFHGGQKIGPLLDLSITSEIELTQWVKSKIELEMNGDTNNGKGLKMYFKDKPNDANASSGVSFIDQLNRFLSHSYLEIIDK